MEKIKYQPEAEKKIHWTYKIIFLTATLVACCTYLSLSGCNEKKAATDQKNYVPSPGPIKKKGGAPLTKSVKYIALSTDTEAYFTPRDFENFQGEFTQQIIEVCQKFNTPFTWLIIVDKEHTEIRTFSKKAFPVRNDIDEFSLHVHFKWFIMDSPDDFKSFKIVERRMKWLKDAKNEIEKASLPMPHSFRYGGGDSKDRYYCIEDLIFLKDEFGIRNFLFSPDRLPEVIGISQYDNKGNNVWIIDGGREITLLSTCVSLDNDKETIITSIDQRLKSSDYAIISSHDYREIVPRHLEMAIEYLNTNYNVEYVTIDRIGEMVRSGEIRNDW